MLSIDLLKEVQSYIDANLIYEIFADGVSEEDCAVCYMLEAYPPELAARLAYIDESFTDMLLRKIDEKGISDADCYNRAQLNRSHFNKIKNNKDYNVQKETVIALALALCLDRSETDELLTKAGYALSPSSVFDLIIEYCISKEIYNVTEVNQLLYAFDQKLLGAGYRE